MGDQELELSYHMLLLPKFTLTQGHSLHLAHQSLSLLTSQVWISCSLTFICLSEMLINILPPPLSPDIQAVYHKLLKLLYSPSPNLFLYL